MGAEAATIPPDEVHVWRVALDVEPTELTELSAVLTPQERAHGEPLGHTRHRARWQAAHGALRRILGGYVDRAPESLVFTAGRCGKPALEGNERHGPWFNLSHSGAWALVAVSGRAEVGVDIEETEGGEAGPRAGRSSGARLDRVAERFFAAEEIAELRALPPDARARAVLIAWTRKEAVLKARGVGLRGGLASFAVTVGPGRPATLLRADWPEEDATRWSLDDLSDPSGRWVAAIATPDRGFRLRERTFVL